MKARFFREFTSGVLIAAAIFMAPSVSRGQDDDGAKLPDGPLLRPAPSYSQWTITYAYPQDQPKMIDASNPSSLGYLNQSPRILVTTKTGDLTHESSIDLLGRRSERWYLGSREYRKAAGNPVWYEDNLGNGSTPGTGASFTPPPPSGFRDLDDASASTYAGTVSYQGRPCLIFIPGGTKTPITKEDQLKDLTDVLIVDAETRLPVEARAAGVVRVFQFGTVPGEKLTFPDDLAAQIKKGNEGRARLQSVPGRPY